MSYEEELAVTRGTTLTKEEFDALPDGDRQQVVAQHTERMMATEREIRARRLEPITHLMDEYGLTAPAAGTEDRAKQFFASWHFGQQISEMEHIATVGDFGFRVVTSPESGRTALMVGYLVDRKPRMRPSRDERGFLVVDADGNQVLEPVLKRNGRIAEEWDWEVVAQHVVDSTDPAEAVRAARLLALQVASDWAEALGVEDTVPDRGLTQDASADPF